VGGQGQVDFSAGIVRNVARHLIPENGARDIRSMLLDDDGNAYLRGPTARASSNQHGTLVGGLWEARLLPGRRTLGIGSAGVATIVAGAWSTLISSAFVVGGGGMAAVLGGYMMLVPAVSGGVSFLLGWGGETTVGATIGGGTAVNVTKGSKTVTLAAGSWAAYVKPGMFLRGSGGFSGIGMVKSVDSTSSLTLTAPWEFATQAMTGYSWSPLATYPDSALTDGGSGVAVAGGRVLVASGRRVVMSNPIDPNTGGSRAWTFSPNDYHEFPAEVVALAALRDRVFVFTKAGIYVISNVALEIVDPFGNPQHRVDPVSSDVILRSAGGVATWRDALVIAAVDGVYTLQPSGQLELVSRSITPLWQQAMASGSSVNQIAVFRDHVFVPVGGQVLVGRLDRSVSTPAGKSAPWTRMVDGELGLCIAFAVQDPTGAPKFIAGSNDSGYLLDLTGIFQTTLPATANAIDANGSAYGLYLETRDHALGATPAYVDRLLLDYESTGGQIGVSVSKGQRATVGADPTFTALATTPGGNFSTQAPRAVAVRKSARYVAFSFASGGNVAGARIRGYSFSTRERGLQR
jgi:hypothetical protein